MPFIRGQPGGPGRPKGRTPEEMIVYDIKQLARSHCPRAIERLAEHMNQDEDRKASIFACKVLIERAYGMPEQKADVAIEHLFPPYNNEKVQALSQWFEY